MKYNFGMTPIKFAVRALPLLLVFLSMGISTTHAAVSFSVMGQNLGAQDSRDAAVGDFDGDGDLDIVECPFGTTERVWLNNGAGTFTNTSSFGSSAYGCKAADMNNNGTMDIIIGVYSPGTNLSIYWNNGAASFSGGPSVSEGYKYGFTIGDIDGDGDVDFTTGASNSLAGRVYRNNGNSTFSQIAANISTAYDRQHVLADVDNDGDLDLIRGVYNAANQVWVNNGSGTFSNLGGQSFTSQSTLDIVAGDFDADGDMDFAEGNGSTNLVWINGGSGTFSAGNTLGGGFSYGIDTGDVDSDGDLDILIGNLGCCSTIYTNGGTANFSATGISITSASTDDALFGEFTGDGKIDVLSVNSGTNAMKVWQNNTAPYTNTTPVAPTLTAQGSRYINANPKAIKFIWTGGSDTETIASMLTYDFRLGTTSGGCEIMCGAFGGSGTAFGPGNATPSPYNFKIAPGTYYWTVRTVDLTYTRSSWSAEDNFTVTLDTVAPTTPTVSDGTGADADYSFGNTTFAANWSASTDATAGIDGYWYSMGTSAGASDTKSWTWAGNVTSVTATGLTLTGGVTYYFSVRAQDNAENLSAVATSDGARPFFYDTGQSLDTRSTYSGDLADLDNDGDLDYIAGNYGDQNRVWDNDGSGIMSAGALFGTNGAQTTAIKAGDVDGDGDVDILVGNWSGPGTRWNKLFLNTGGVLNDSGQVLNNTQTSDIDLGDWDKDGDLDMIEANYGTDDILWQNNGSGTFTTTGQVLTGASTTGAKFIDFDNDGDLDIVREIYGLGNKIWRNDSGTYTDQGTSTNTQQQDIQIADFDGDGDMDYAYAMINSGFRARVLKNDGSGTFTTYSGTTGPTMNSWGLDVGDMDNDGDVDIVDAGEVSGDIYLNDGIGGLTYVLSLPGGTNGSHHVNAGDLDGDGDLDLVFGNYNNSGDKVWINFLNASNNNPSAPTISAQNDIGVPLGKTVKQIVLGWSAGNDAETTNATLLTYDVRLGSSSGAVDVLGVLFNGTPNYMGNNFGNTAEATSYTMDFSEGTYYWSARTVDTSFNTSSWDTEDSFVILPPFTDTGQALGGTGDSRMPCAGDFDGDGDLDVAETNFGGGGANFLWRNNGSGTMTNTQTWSTNPSQDCDVGDFDGDGDLDIAETNYSSTKNKIYFNNGSGTFSGGGDVGAAVSSNNMLVADFDGDGDLDLYEGNNGTTNYIQLNDGTGTFSQGSAMGAAASTNSDVSDIDGDGDMDIAIAMYGSANYLWVNNGDATFYDAGIYMNIDSTRAVKFADVDGDGDPDLIFGNMASQPNRVWINDDGAGGYIDSGQTLGAEQTSGIDVGDIDGDGDIDFIAGNKNTPSADLVWLNDGSGNFTDSGFQMGAYTGTWTVLLLDLDNDGDLDVFEACQGQANRVWRSNQNFANTAPTAPALTPEPDINPIWAATQSVSLVWSVGSDAETTDTDLLTYDVRMGTSTGACDVFCGFFPKTSLLNNGPGIMGNANSLPITLDSTDTTTYYWSVRTVDATNKGGTFSAEDSFTLTPAFEDSGQTLGTTFTFLIALGDLDGDNDLDIIDAHSSGVLNQIWLNDGNASFSIGAAFSAAYDSRQPVILDVDGDGDLDFFEVTTSANKLWLNNGTGTFTDSGQSIGAQNDTSGAAADFDGDGHIDVLTGCYYCTDHLWLNDGNGTFSDSGQTLGAGTSAYQGDIDNDGDVDYLMSHVGGGGNQVWINDGTGTFTNSGQTLGTDTTYQIALADVDGDGDDDVITGNGGSAVPDKVWLNNGSGVFTNSGQLLGSYLTTSVFPADLDGDGDIDYAAACNTSSPNRIWLNNGSGVFTDSGISLGADSSWFVTGGDLDADDDIDLAVANATINRIYVNNLNPTNTTPVAPVLTDEADFMTWSNTTDTVTLNWSAGSDAETTNAVLLTYDVRIGTSPDTCDIFCGLFPSSGTTPLLGNGYGNTGHSTSLTIAVPTVVTTTYYWSARTVDATYKRSSFATNDTFTLTPAFEDSGQNMGADRSQAVDIADFDGDGTLDIVWGNTLAGNTVWTNNGSGVFSDSGESMGGGDTTTTVAVDIDGDGDLDILESMWSANNALWINNGSANFADSGQTFSAVNTGALQAADLDSDGDVDFITGNDNGVTNLVYLNNGTGTFSLGASNLGTFNVRGIQIFDTDGDGDNDVVLANINGSATRIWNNSGDASFTDSGQTLGTGDARGLSAVDVDADGDRDLIISTDSAVTKVWRNNGSGTFSDSGQSLSSSVHNLAVADIDGDGDMDAVFIKNGGSTTAAYNEIWLNDSAGIFTDSGIRLGPEVSYSLAIADLDGDGDIDIAEANRNYDPNKVWINNQNHGNNAPSAPFLSAKPDSNTSSVQLQWNTGGVTDAETPAALLTYDVRIGTSSGGCETFCGLFPNSAPYLGTGPGNAGATDSITKTLPDGTYYWSARTVDTGFKASAWTAEDSFLIDTTPPSTIATVNDSAGADVDFASSATQLLANWTTSTDAQSGVVAYWIGIGTSAGATDTLGWTDAGLIASTTTIDLSLIDGTTYFFTVRAENGVGLLATAANSDGQLVDASAPSSVTVSDSTSADVDYATSSTQLSANWTSSADAHSGITRYWYAIGTTAGGTDVVSWTDNALSTSVTKTGLTLTDGVTYYLSVRAENGTNLLAVAANSDGQLVDTSVPSSVTVSDSLGADVTFASSSTQLSANWTSSADAHSGISRYWYAIGTTAGGTDVVSWTDNALSTSVTKTGLTLTDGVAYYVTVRAENNAGLLATAADSDGQTVDTSAPSSVTVSDSTSSDVDYATSSTQLSANWTSSADAHSGITRYWYAIGTTAGGTDVRSWTNNALSTSVTATGLTLTDGVTYYFSVRSENGAALLATAGNSDGQLVDTSAPSSVTVSDSTSADVDYATSSTQLSANWTSSTDAHSGITRYWYAIGTTAGGTDVVSWTDNALSTSVTATGLTLTDGVTYYFTVRAENNAGLLATAANSDGQLVDTSSPSSVLVSDGPDSDAVYASSTTQLLSNWTSSTDTHSGISKYWYAIGTTAGGTNVRTWTDNGLSTSVTASGLALTEGATYYFSVRAENNAGLLATAANSNGMLVDVTPPAVVSAVTADTDSDGYLNTLTITFNSTLYGTGEIADWTITDGDGITDLFSGLVDGDIDVSGTVVTVTFANNTGTTGATTYSYTQAGTNNLRDAAGNPVAGIVSATATDNAPPVFMSLSSSRQMANSNIPTGTVFTIVFSEDVVVNGSQVSAADWIVTSGSWHGGATVAYADGAGYTMTATLSSDSTSGDWIPFPVPTMDRSAFALTNANSIEDATGNDAIANSSSDPQIIGIFDLTPPYDVSTVNDGIGADNSYWPYGDRLAANWSASADPETGIYRYWYAVGTASGTDDVQTWTTNNINTASDTITGLSLTDGTVYHLSVKAQNGAYMDSNPRSSNGVMVDASAPDTCTISSITPNTGTTCQYAISTTLYYNNNLACNSGGGSFTVAASGSDPHSKVQKINFPATVSAAADSNAPGGSATFASSLLYTYDSTDTFSSSASSTIYNYSGLTTACLFSVIRDVTAPVTTDNWTDNWTASASVPVALSATDGTGSAGVSTTKMCTGTANTCSPTAAGTSNTFTCASNAVCVQYIRYFSTDMVSNAETVKSERIRQDLQKPTTTDNWTDNWTTSGSVTITLTPTDGSGSGIASTVYCVDTTNTCTPSTSGTSVVATCANLQSCTQYVRYFSTDNVNNAEAVNSKRVRQDLQKPATADNWTDNWISSGTIIITLTPTDSTGSGIASTVYCTDTANTCTPSTSGTSVVATCADLQACTQYVRYMSTDMISNAEVVKSKRVRQDMQKPTTTDNWTDEWTASGSITTTLTPTDGSGSGLASTIYCVDTDNTCTPSTSGTSVVTTCADLQTCTQYVRYFSTDNVSNAETVNSKRVRQDRNLPLATTIAPANIDSGTHVDTTFDMSTTFTTTGAPVVTCSYCKSTDGTCDTEWTAATWEPSSLICSVTGLTCTGGQALTLNMKATNNVGGAGYGIPVSRTCDGTAPVTTDNWSGILSNASPVTVTLSPTDNSAGVQATYYCVDTTDTCTPATAGTAVVVSCAAGTVCTQYARYFSVDNTGNTETVKSKQVKQDMKFPAALITTPVEDEEIDGGVTITGTATDENFKEYALYYGPGASPTKWGVIVATSTTPVASGTFAQWDTSTKYGIYSLMLKVVDLSGNISTIIRTVGLYTRENLSTEIPADEWRMISVPGMPLDSDPVKCFNHNDFIIIKWSEALPEDSHMMKYSQTFSISAGSAFWTKSYVVKAVCDAPSMVTDTTQTFNMPVAAGWNQIGVPFNRDFSWSLVKFRQTGSTVELSMADAISTNKIDSAFFAYENNGYAEKGINATLSPYGGYFVKTLADGELLFDPAAGLAAGVARTTSDKKYAWRLQLAVESNELRDAHNYAGESASSSDTFDSSDAAEPPFIDPYIALYFQHDNWDSPGRYSADIRSSRRNATGEEKTWVFVVRTSAPETDAKISWPNAELLPDGYSFTITDLDSGTTLDPKTTGTYSFKTGNQNTRRFSLSVILTGENENLPSTVKTTLDAGWSLVSIPLEPITPSATSILEKHASIISLIHYSNDNYSYSSNQEMEFSPGNAYWVYSTETTDLSLQGWELDPDASVEIQLTPGYNMIGSPFVNGLLFSDNIAVVTSDTTTMTLSEAISKKLLDKWIFEYNTSTNSYVILEQGNIMLPWKGYFVKANKYCSLILEK